MRNRMLETIIATSIPLVESIFFRNTAPNTPAERLSGGREALINNSNITPYIGNYPESFIVPAISGIIGDMISAVGERTGSNFLQKTGNYMPEISAIAINTYFALGETILPQILPGTADIRDMPAVVLSSLAGYALAKVGRDSGFNKAVLGKINYESQ